MKTLTTLATFLFLATFAQAQYSFQVDRLKPAEVPADVKSSFKSHFPDTKPIRWERHTGKGKFKTRVRYVAIFNDGKNRARARYRDNASGISATTYYFAPGLPNDVKAGARKKHPGYKVVAGQKIRIFKSDRTVYRVKLRKGASRVWIYLNPDGSEAGAKDLPDDVTEDEGLE